MEPFIDYCKNGDIEGIENMSLEGCDLNRGFSWACSSGHYNVVRFLVELYRNDSTYTPINIPVYNNQGFLHACFNGHYTIVRYLVELYRYDSIYKPIVIDFWHELCFRKACENEHSKVINYLLRITKKHKHYKPFHYYLMAFKKLDKFLL